MDPHSALTPESFSILATFLRAAHAVGLGCCPISVIRDHAARVSELLGLPEKVVPYAGLCVGWPATEGRISARLDRGAVTPRCAARGYRAPIALCSRGAPPRPAPRASPT